jgi:tetratricopeptide (TPR) repeat protein
VVLLSGEPGIGKSRLTAALLERVAPEPHTRLRYFCSPQRTDSAFFPIISQIERAARFAHDDTVQVKLEKLDALLVQSYTSTQDAALFAEMLSLPNDGRYPALELTPQQRRQKTLEALHAQVETLARKNPVLMIFEDAHWADPTSLELFGRGVSLIANLPVLLIITFRLEFEPPWIGQPHVTALSLNRLTRHDIQAMIDRIVGNKPLLANVRQDIIERTDGIPLFVEEMTKAVLEADSQSAVERTAGTIPSPTLAVPASLHASLMARLDRLGAPAKEVAQIGAAIGREVSHALLAAVVGKPEAELKTALDRIVAAGLLFRQGVPPHATYLFKHALVQDAAYGTLLREPRRALHAHIADTLESQFTEIAENQPEILARHCTEAGLIAKAAGLWGKAGQRSVARSALVEAVEQLTRALALIATLPTTPELRCEEIRLQVALITPLTHVRGYAAPETKAAVERARLLIEQAEALGEPPEDPLLLFSVLYGNWAANIVAFNGGMVRQLAEQFLALAKRQGATIPLLLGHRLMGYSLMMLGDFVEAQKHLDDAIARYDLAEHSPLAPRFGQESGVSILSTRSYVRWFLGKPEAALTDADLALKNARAIGHAPTLMFALSHASVTHRRCRRYATSYALVAELTALAENKGASFWKAMGMAHQGELHALTGKFSDAIRSLTAGIMALRSTGATFYVPYFLSDLARAYAELGQFNDALALHR